MSHVAVTAVGADRPGIVAAFTQVFVAHGCNLEDCSMTILRGQFAMMLVVDVPPGVGAAALEAALAAPAAELDLLMAVRAIPEPPEAGDGAEPSSWTVSVYGADHPGIVHGVAALMAAHGVNIVDLSTRVAGEADRPVYAMVLEIAVPPGLAPAQLQAELEATAGELGVTCRMHPSEADIL